MNADAKVTERQCAVWQALLRRRFDTASNLAVEFHVSVRTMQNDLHELMLGDKVFLETWVKVKKNWRDKKLDLADFGYNEKEY